MSENIIHACAQRGDLEGLRRALDEGSDVHARDQDGVTPLHWAAINGHYECCQLLLSRGADVNITGGTLRATPMHWCTRQGQVQVMSLLLDHGANPLQLDGQGFHTLHLATHSSLVMTIVYLLQRAEFQPQVALDRKDTQGHTALMWAAFQGDALSVDVLLKHGAAVHVSDMDGLTPLHWAVVHGNRLCILRLIEAGSDLKAREHKGQTPCELARELGTYAAYRSAMKELDRKDNGEPGRFLLSRRAILGLVFTMPCLMYELTFIVSGRSPWFLAPLVFVLGIFATHVYTTAYLLQIDHAKGAHASPYYLSLVCLSVVLGVAHYCVFLSGISLARDVTVCVLATSLVYFFFLTARNAPGQCAKPASKAELRRTIDLLAREGRLSGLYFCATCMSRKPMRAKHCIICNTCVARHDHHCPWVMNCIGLNNHAPFLIALAFAQAAITAFHWATWAYFRASVSPSLVAQQRCPLFPWLCAAVSINGSLYYTAVWLLLTQIWVGILLAFQLYQISTQVTTFELVNLKRHGFMAGRPDANMLGQGQAGYIKMQSEHLLAQGLSPYEVKLVLHGRSPVRRGFCGRILSSGSSLLAIVGLDLYSRHSPATPRAPNPFDHGCLTNWMDFASRGKHDGIDYTRLYDVP